MSNGEYVDPVSGRRYTVDPQTGQSRWVDEVVGPPRPAFVPPPVRKGHGLRNTLIVVGGLFGLLLVIGAIGNAINPPPKVTATVTAAAQSSESAIPSAKSPSTPATPAKPSTTSAAPTTTKPSPKGPRIGTPVRDGKFEFTVLQVKAGVASIGNDVIGEKAQGQFVLVTMKVENIGDEAQTFMGSAQKLFDTKGRTFEADDAAALYLDDAKSWLNQINPGNTVTGVVVFDVPKSVTLSKMELHDSIWSGGVEVGLT
jgi:hypothetical protein